MSELKNKEEQYDIFLQSGEHATVKGKILSFAGKAVAVVAVIIFLFFAARSFFTHDNLTVLSDKMTGAERLNTPKKQDLTPSKFNFNMLSRYQNILVLGVDSNGPNTLPYSGVRSDTIIIINIDLKGKSINAISIPRDSKVYLADERGIQKINSAYAFGGIELTKKTIEETFGIKIHNYVVLNTDGIREIIDAIGGIPIHIDQNMRYHDNSAKLHINFDKGDYVLNGAQAEEYLRFRKDMFGDIGRVHRQQKFVKALIEKIKSPDTLRKLPEVIKIAGLYSRTDLNLYQMSQYAALARETDMNKVEFVMMPGSPNKKGIISYWILDPEKTQQVINRLIYRINDKSADEKFTVGIMYTKAREFDATTLKDTFKAEGFDVNCTGRSSQITKSEIIGYNTQIPVEKIKDIRKSIPLLNDMDFTHSPVRSHCDASDFVITLADDIDTERESDIWKY